jgi:hypothetical protein
VPEVIFYVEKADVGYVHMNVDVLRYRLMKVCFKKLGLISTHVYNRSIIDGFCVLRGKRRTSEEQECFPNSKFRFSLGTHFSNFFERTFPIACSPVVSKHA